MSNETGRRKLQLLPEVLPDPMLNRDRTTGPRDRTLKHMQRLFATAAAATAVAGCGDKTDAVKPDPASSTTSKTAAATASALSQTDPVPPQTAIPEASSSAHVGADPVSRPDAGDDAGVKKPIVQKPPPPPPTHYMVVDPVPTPFRMPGKNGPNQP